MAKNDKVKKLDTAEVESKGSAKSSKKSKKVQKKANVFVRIWKWFAKLCKDTVGEMKKVVWTPRAELKKSTKLVIVTVIAISVIIAVIDTACSYLINTVAGIIG